MQALGDAASNDSGMRKTIMQHTHPSLLAQAVVSGFGEPPIADRYQAALYFLSADAKHKPPQSAGNSITRTRFRSCSPKCPQCTEAVVQARNAHIPRTPQREID
jgi:hypothetical protein